MENVLEISNLSVSFVQYEKGIRQRIIMPVKNLNFTVREQEILAIVGASGSGKSLLAHAVLGVLPSNAKVSGIMKYQGEILDEKRILQLRGKDIRFIPQSIQYLDPTRKVGRQLHECFEQANKNKVVDMLREIDLSPEVYDLHPHELSGGMLRRILFATCKGKHPKLIIADEPTPGIHPEALEEILHQFTDFRNQGKSVIFITHDMKSAMEIADRIAIFKEGEVIGIWTPNQISGQGSGTDAYTKKLWAAQPRNEFLEAVR